MMSGCDRDGQKFCSAGSTTRATMPNPDALSSFGDLSLVSDDFSRSLGGDCCSPFDMGPGAPSLSSDSPFDLALSIAEGGSPIFDLTWKESSTKSFPTSIPEAFISSESMSGEMYPMPQATFVSSITVDAKTLGAKTCAGLEQTGGGTSKPASTAAFELNVADTKPQATFHSAKAETFADNTTKKKSTARATRRSPRRSTMTTKAGVTIADSGISTQSAALATKSSTRATVASMSGAAGTKKKVAAVKKGSSIKKAAGKGACHCRHCGRAFTKEGLEYHLGHMVCRKGQDTSKMVRLVVCPSYLASVIGIFEFTCIFFLAQLRVHVTQFMMHLFFIF